MNKIFSFYIGVALILLSISGIAQSSEYRFNIGTKNYGNHGIKTLDSGYVFCTSGYVTGGPSLSSILKVDSSFSLQWQKSFEHAYFQQIRQTYDSNYITAGSTWDTAVVVKFDQSGNIIWKKDYVLGWIVNIHSIEETTDHGLILSGDLGYATVPLWETIIKLDSAGNYSWLRYLDANDSAVANAAHETSDGGYILAGNFSPTPGTYTSIHLSKFDALGIHSWSKTYQSSNSSSTVSISQTSDNGYILTAQCTNGAMLIRTDSVGDTLWVKSYGYNSNFVSVNQLPDGGFVACGNSSLKFWVIRTDLLGNVIWSETYSDFGEFTWGSSVEVSNDSQLVLTGSAIRQGSMFDFNLYFIVTDFSGTNCFPTNNNIQAVPEVITVTTDTPVVVNIVPIMGTSALIPFAGGLYFPWCMTTPVEEIKMSNSIQISPNPANQFLRITCSLKLKSISVFDLFGKKILAAEVTTVKLNSTADAPSVDLDVFSLPAGLYFLQAETEQGTFTSKFIKD